LAQSQPVVEPVEGDTTGKMLKRKTDPGGIAQRIPVQVRPLPGSDLQKTDTGGVGLLASTTG